MSGGRLLRRAMLALVLTCFGASASRAAEVTLQMKGGGFQVTGDLVGFDGAKYVIQSKALGVMTLEASRFDCVGTSCPKAPLPSAQPQAPAPAQANLAQPAQRPQTSNLGTATFMGGTVIGTEFMPRLVQSFADSIGATVTRVAAADPRNIEFKLTDKNGAPIGQVNVYRQGIAPAFEAMLKGEIDVVMSGRTVEEAEVQKYLAAGLPNLRSPGSEHVWGLDSMVVLVAKENPAISLSLDNVAQIFAGKVTDWSQIGLPPGKITVYAPNKEFGTWNQFDTMVMKPRNLTLREDAKLSPHATEWSDLVAKDPLGISINGIAYVRNAKPVNIEASCGLITRPSVFGAKTEEYPLTRRMYFYTPGPPKNPMARAIIAHALSPAVQEVLKQANFVDQEPELLDFTAQATRVAYALNAQSEDFDMAMMRQLITELKPASRLSITFRFQTASFTLDNKALQDVERLRALLATPEYRNKQVMLIGFADAVGRFDANLKLAEKRSGAVFKALTGGRTAGITSIAAKAYGELAPVACNDQMEGRQFNRRVEVWVRNQ
jgi:phosphate transport system substrate-binding protein